MTHLVVDEAWNIAAEEEISHEEYMEKDEKADNIKKVMEDIPEEDKKLLVLKYQYGASIKELEHQFNLKASAVKMRLLRSKKKVMDLHTNHYYRAAV